MDCPSLGELIFFPFTLVFTGDPVQPAQPSVTTIHRTYAEIDLSSLRQLNTSDNPVQFVELRYTPDQSTPAGTLPWRTVVIRSLSNPVYRLRSLQPDNAYLVQLRTVNGFGYSQWSPSVSFITLSRSKCCCLTCMSVQLLQASLDLVIIAVLQKSLRSGFSFNCEKAYKVSEGHV